MDDLLLRISLEKVKSPTLEERQLTPYPLDDSSPLSTPDELEQAPIAQMASRSSSGLSSYCGQFVDDLLVRISLEKMKSPVLEERQRTPYAFDDFTPSLTPDELEQAPIAQMASRSSSGLSSYCGKLVDDLLVRISVEKVKSPVFEERQQTPYAFDDCTPSLTPDELEQAPIAQMASRSSSGLSSYCEKFVDDILVRISLEKMKSPVLEERQQTPYAFDDCTPSLTPDELEQAPIAQMASRSSSGLSSYCGQFGDDLLVRISLEKMKSPVLEERQRTPYAFDDCTPSLTPDELEQAPIAQMANRSSSGLSSYCGKFVDDLLVRISLEKVKSPVLEERLQTPYTLEDSSPSLTPDELEHVPIVENASRSSSGLSIHCSKFVDDLLLRVSYEKEMFPAPEKMPPSVKIDDDNRSCNSRSSLQSFCDKFVDDLLLRVTVEKEQPPVPTERELSSASSLSLSLESQSQVYHICCCKTSSWLLWLHDLVISLKFGCMLIDEVILLQLQIEVLVACFFSHIIVFAEIQSPIIMHILCHGCFNFSIGLQFVSHIALSVVIYILGSKKSKACLTCMQFSFWRNPKYSIISS